MAWADMADRVLQKTINTFKIAGTYTPASGSGAYAVDGVFSKPYQPVDAQQGGALVTSSHPTYGVRLADLAAIPAEGDTVTISAVVYRVLDAQGDGEGGYTLTLHQNN